MYYKQELAWDILLGLKPLCPTLISEI